MARLSQICVVAIAAVALHAPVNAAVTWCSPRVTYVTLTPSGVLYPGFEGMGTPLLCNINGDVAVPGIGTVTADVCKAWYASLTTALATQKTVTMGFDFGASAAPACNAFPVFSWALPNPYPFFMQFDR
jgi:hypothetical protein